MRDSTVRINYLAHLADDSERFAEVLRPVHPAARVPSCPDWTAADLLWHLGRVQWFWSRVVRHRPTPPEDITEPDPVRPHEVAALRGFGEQSTNDLLAALTEAGPDEAAWTWAEEHTVGFVYRRQAHEALIHRLDAELTANRRSAMDVALCSDGVDEALRIMYGGVPPEFDLVPDDHRPTLRLTAADTGRQWLVEVARLTGGSNGGSREEPTLLVADRDDGRPADATITATAEDLDCWLWHRPPRHEVTRHGDHAALTAFTHCIAPGIA